MRKHPNLFNSLEIQRPEQAFVSDITCVVSGEGVHYLSLVTYACSRKFMGHELSWQMKASDTAKALHRAAANRITQNDLLHHSDRASQYLFRLLPKSLSDPSHYAVGDRWLRLLSEPSRRAYQRHTQARVPNGTMPDFR
jgi:putative transposase